MMGDRTLIRLGRSIAAAGALSGVAGGLVAMAAGEGGAWWRAFGPTETTIAVAFAVIVWLVIEHQPRNLTVWAMVCATWIGFEAGGLGPAVAILDGAPVPEGGLVAPATAPASVAWILVVARSLTIPGLYVPLTLGLLWFPDGRLESQAARILAAVTVADLSVFTVAYGWWNRPGNAEVSEGPVLAASNVFMFVLTVASVIDLGRRYRQSEGTTRLQYKWVLWGTTVGVLVFGGFSLGPDAASQPTALGLLAMVAAGCWAAGYGIAVGRYRLYDIDVVISRTLVYVGLAVLISATYVVLVVGLGGMIGGSDLWLSVLATAVVAVTFEPIRARLSVLANRLVYGRRATPHEVLADLMARLTLAESPDRLLDRLVERLQAGTGAHRTAVWRSEGDRAVTLAVSPGGGIGAQLEWRLIGDLPGTVVPIEHDGSAIGWLTVEEAPGMAVQPVDVGLAEDLAGSAALVLHRRDLDQALLDKAVEVGQSRRRLVSAQDEELRRLERELEQGIEQKIVALKVRLDQATASASGEVDERLASLLASIADGAEGAVEQVRALAHGIYPSVLETDGLAAAVASLAAGSGLDVELDIDLAHRHPLPLEEAIYFCLAEALTNGAKHATGPFTLAVEDRNAAVSFEVRDHGPGFDPNSVEEGAGLHNMADRIDAVGGDVVITSQPGQATVVTGRIPLDPAMIELLESQLS